MTSKRNHLVLALGTLAIGVALVLASPIGAQATDAIDDPVRQPHLKSWSNVIPNASKRFVVLDDFNNEAVLDRETGLVWEKSPGLDTGAAAWVHARFGCLSKVVGGQRGWRLPSIIELSTLLDPSVVVEPRLSVGHLFINVGASYWSATTVADMTTHAWLVRFRSGGVPLNIKENPHEGWCVRGPMNADVY